MSTIVGLDIGTTKVVAIAGRRNEQGKFEILSMGEAVSNGVNRGMVQNIKETQDAIRRAISKVEAELGIKVTRVMVGIAGEHIRSVTHREHIIRDEPDNLITEKDIEQLENQVRQLSMKPGESIVNALVQEYQVDSHENIQQPIGMKGQRLEANFHLVIGKTEAIRNIYASVTGLGLTLESLTLEPIASAQSVLSKEEKEVGVALIDMGGGTTDLTIFSEGRIRHTAFEPFGGEQITRDIMMACRLLKKQAEDIKIKFAEAWASKSEEDTMIELRTPSGTLREDNISSKNLTQIAYEVVREIIGRINDEIQCYLSLNPEVSLHAGVVITGGGANLKHIAQVIRFITGMEVRIGNPSDYLEGTNTTQTKDPKYATVVGLLMESVEKAEENKEKPLSEQKSLEQDEKEENTFAGVFKRMMDKLVHLMDSETKKE